MLTHSPAADSMVSCCRDRFQRIQPSHETPPMLQHKRLLSSIIDFSWKDVIGWCRVMLCLHGSIKDSGRDNAEDG